ncbi:zinc finger X-chromosomal protein [Anastrepha ludens]|uniref:zinc finger X-chromosomal protein n=1 Tax=Anastrepha ludens TaxID=28586 RepID=UPI0023AFA752|nr:zinc finger X-chromosomal protein [Anastrepha ludens]
MKSCNLCKHKYDKLFKPDEKLLDIKLGSVINIIFGDHQVEVSPNFLICTECALALIQTEIVLKRLSSALTNNKKIQNVGLNNSKCTAKNKNSDEVENHDKEDLDKSSKEVPDADAPNLDNTLIGWKFCCIHCKYTTEKPKTYKKHLISKHEDDNPRIYQCPHCTVTYQRANAIQNHINSAHGKKPAPKRRKTIADVTPILLSSTTIHSQVDNDTSIANKTYDGIQENGENSPYEFECGQCKYKTMHATWFKKHLQSKHQDEDARIYKCKQCPSTYIRQFALQNHIAYEHEHKPRPKPQRRKSLATVFELNATGDKELLLSNIKFQTEEHNGGEVNGEIDNINQNGDISVNKTDDEQQNKEHIFQAPKTNSRNQINSNEMPKPEWIFQCSYCEFESGKRKKYKTHLKTQHGDISDSDIYKCLYCPASFERYSLLQSHVPNKHSIDLTELSDTQALDSSQDHLQVRTTKKRKVEETPIKSNESGHTKSTQDERASKRKNIEEKDQQKESCILCEKTFSSVDKLRTHVDKYHDGEAQFRSKEKKEAHLIGEKSLDTKLACPHPSCSKRFRSHSKMQQHMLDKHADLLS